VVEDADEEVEEEVKAVDDEVDSRSASSPLDEASFKRTTFTGEDEVDVTAGIPVML
jgi:hypothetical protein